MSHYLFTSESVSEGHPDKIADQISDAVLDAIIAQDKHARVACETLIKTGMVVLAGEVTTSAWVDLEDLVRKTVVDIGYNSSDIGFDGSTCGVFNAIGKQSSDIAQGVDREEKRKQGAGDQGLMFGYACDETPTLMPAPIMYAHRLVERQAQVRRDGVLPWLRPDAKSQVTFRYEDDKITGIDAVVLSTQHDPDISQKDLQEAVRELIIDKVLPAEWLDSKTKFHINPTGKFVIGGPVGDCGLTGRKIIVDTYGGSAHHGGGAFSGKDPSKVDRSAAYAGRYVAKNIVAAGLANVAKSRCLTPSASPSRLRSWSIPSAPAPLPTRKSSSACGRCLTSPLTALSKCLTSSARFTARPPLTATLAANCRTSPGKKPTAPPR